MYPKTDSELLATVDPSKCKNPILQVAYDRFLLLTDESAYEDDSVSPLYRRLWREYLGAGGNRTMLDPEIDLDNWKRWSVFPSIPFTLGVHTNAPNAGFTLTLTYQGRWINTWQTVKIPLITCDSQIGNSYFLTWDQLGAFFDADDILNRKPAPLQFSLFAADTTDDWGDSREQRLGQRRLL